MAREVNPNRRDSTPGTRAVFVGVFGLALVIRLLWLGMAAGAHDSDSVKRLFPDSARYEAMAQYILGRGWHFPDGLGMLPSDPAYRSGEGALLYHPPGYPWFLIAVHSLLGQSVWPVLAMQAVLSAVSCALIARIGHQAFGSTSVALWAGVIASVSPTSISLASMIGTETLFAAVFLASMTLAIDAWRRGSWRRALAAGVLTAAGALIKPVLYFCPILTMIAAGVLMMRRDPGLRRRGRWLAGLATIPIGVIAGWTLTNAVQRGVATPAEMAVHNMRFMWAARVQSYVENGRDIEAIQREWAAELSECVSRRPMPLERLHGENRQAGLAVVRRHPWYAARAFAAAVIENCIAPSDLHAFQSPQLAGLWRVTDPILRRVIGPLVPLLMLICAIAAYRGGHRRAVVGLLLVYAYFAITSGQSYWAGSRYLYLAQVSWCVLMAWAADRAARQLSLRRD